MMGLLADGWFYISSAGLLISGMLFFFLLGQYRVASEAADAEDGGEHTEKEAPAPTTIRPVYMSEEPVAAPRVISHREPEPEPKREASPETQKNPNTTTDAISPAVVYLQNIKGELADLHKDVRTLAKRVDDELASVSTRDEALIERLAELTRAVEAMKASAAVAPAAALAPAIEPTSAPAPKRRKADKAPEPAPETAPAPLITVTVPEPKADPVIAPAPEPARSPEETIRMELGALIATQEEIKAPVAEPVSEPVAEPAAAADAAASANPTSEPEPTPAPEDKPRRGPVWPV